MISARDQINKILIVYDLTPQQAGSICNVSPFEIARYTEDNNDRPPVSTVSAFATAFGVSFDWMCSGTYGNNLTIRRERRIDCVYNWYLIAHIASGEDKDRCIKTYKEIQHQLIQERLGNTNG